MIDLSKLIGLRVNFSSGSVASSLISDSKDEFKSSLSKAFVLPDSINSIFDSRFANFADSSSLIGFDDSLRALNGTFEKLFLTLLLLPTHTEAKRFYLELLAGEYIKNSEPSLEMELAASAWWFGAFGGDGKMNEFFLSISGSEGFDGVRTIGSKDP